MVQTILVPLDGSPAAAEAVAPAAWLAEQLGAHLALVRPVTARVRPGDDPAATRAARCAAAHSYLEDQAVRARDRFPRVHMVASVPVGPWPNVVLDAVTLERADLIVASTQLAGDGYGAPAGLLGSAAVVLSRRAEVPVVLVPGGATIGGPHPGALRGGEGKRLRVLVPLDGSPPAEAILPLVVRYGAAIPMRVTVLHVVSPHELSTTGAAYCQRVAQWLTQHGVPSKIELRAGNTVEEIGRAAHGRMDLLALGLPEALPWRFGYSAEQLLRRSGVPVLQLRSRRGEAVVPSDVSVSSGMAARMVVPAPGEDSTKNRPPTSAMRS